MMTDHSYVGSPSAGELYWIETYPVLLQSLAAMSPGMHALDVADLLDELDQETMRSAEPGQCMDFSDSALIKLYLNQLAI